MRLQDSVINKIAREAKANGKRIELGDQDTRCLRLRITPNGVVSWSLLCKDATGRTRRYLIGNYPGLGLRDARIKAQRLREQVRDGFDPISEKRKIKREMEDAKRRDGLTLRALFDKYETLGKGSELKSWRVGRDRLSSMFKELIDKEVGQIALADLQTRESRVPEEFRLRRLGGRPPFYWCPVVR